MHTEQHAIECLHFIEKYRQFEEMNYTEAFADLREIFSDHHNVDHVCSGWKEKQKDFSSWYLGKLGTKDKINLHRFYGLFDPYDDYYIEECKKDPKAALFLTPSNQCMRMHNLVLFFNNHGINPKVTFHNGVILELHNLPDKKSKSSFDSKNPCFGNSTNWGKYLLRLPAPEQVRIVLEILNNYQASKYHKAAV